MSEFEKFMKKNKKEKANIKYAATKSLCDENGNPLKWELKPLTSSDAEKIREACTEDGRLKFWKYRTRVITACVVCPDLSDAELQDSYGVVSEEALLKAMVDDVNEYDKLFNKIDSISDTETLSEKVEEAKN